MIPVCEIFFLKKKSIQFNPLSTILAFRYSSCLTPVRCRVKMKVSHTLL